MIKFDSEITAAERDSIIEQCEQLGEVIDTIPAPSGFVICSVEQAEKFYDLLEYLDMIDGIYFSEPYYLTTNGVPMIVSDGILLSFHETPTQSLIDSLENALGIALDEVFGSPPYMYRFRRTEESTYRIVESANTLHELSAIRYAHPDFVAAIERNSVDPYFLFDYFHPAQDHIKKVIGDFNSGHTVWDFAETDNPVVVAVFDDGIAEHEDLPGVRILDGYDFCCANADPTPALIDGHGMGCAGIIAASHTTDSSLAQDSTTGIISMAPHVLIMPIKIFPDCVCSPWCSCCYEILDSDLARAFDSASAWGADIITNSWSYKFGIQEKQSLNDALVRAYTQGRNGKGCPIFFSSGNHADTQSCNVRYPAYHDSVFAVGATTLDDSLWDYSCYGHTLDICAPSGDVCFQGDVFTLDQMGDNYGYNYMYNSTEECFPYDPWNRCLNSNYNCYFGGTSAAAPLVAGAAALLLSRRPELTAAEVYNILDSSSVEVFWSDPVSRDSADFEWGRLDAYRMMLSVVRGDANNDGIVNVGDAVYLVNYIFDNGPPPYPDLLNGDANCDATVDNGDPVYIVNYIFRGGNPPKICFNY